ncbi:MAG: right-handed parallel beta-helix repeat-containing protein [Acidobacteriota bacterium]
MRHLPLFLAVLSLAPASAAVRSVGPGQPYAKPCQAFAAAQDGDVIEIDAAGNYDGDVCAIYRNNLTIRGVNGRARIDAAGMYALGKGIWVVAGDNIVVENIEFSGARVPDRNGAGIRLDSGNLTVRNCVFHDNETGILGGFYGRVLIEHSEFYDNGYGDGQSHNIYINGGVAEFTLRYSASRRSIVGHLVKSRAAANFILYNRLTQESGNGSYEIDLPNGGVAYVIGNIVQQGDTTQNRGMLTFGVEGLRTASPNELYVVNNTFVSTRAAGATFLQISSSFTTPAVVWNNIFSGSGILTTQSNAQLAGNVTSGDMGFLDPAQFDYRISNLSAALNAGVEPGSAGGFSLRPVMQYKHPLCAVPRSDVGPIDAGAYEYGVPETNAVCAGTPDPPPPPPAPELAAFALSASGVEAGSTVTGTVTLSAAAPAGGVTVALSSSLPGVVAVPASITVPEGATAASVQLQASTVSSETTVVLAASLAAKTLQATLTVRPATSQPGLAPLAKLSRSPSRVRPGQDFTLAVQLAQPAPAGGVIVRFSSSSASVKVPSSVVIAAGASSAKLQCSVDATAVNGAVSIQAVSANTLVTYVLIRAVR